MSYVLSRFGTYDLPIENPRSDNVGGEVQASLVTVAGDRAFDVLGSAIAMQKPRLVTKNFTIQADTAAGYRTASQALRSWLGVRDQLFRTWPDGTVEWAYARMIGLRGSRGPKHPAIDMTAEWLVYSPAWYGQGYHAWLLDDGFYLDAGLFLDAGFTQAIPHGSISLPNAGTVPITEMVITITAATSTITALTITIGGSTIIGWSGSLPVGQSLVIDTGAQSVLKNGNDDYANLSINAVPWATIPVGGTTISVAVTGGGSGSTADYDYWEGWQ